MAAEDIVSNSLIKLWECMKKGNVDPVAPFLFSILKNCALDYLKHETVKNVTNDSIRKALNRELNIRTTSLESSASEDLFSKEINRILDVTLQSIPEKTKEIFILSRFKGKSYKEIAVLFNLSQKGVEYHISHVIKLLRIALRDYLPLAAFMFFLNF